MQFDRLKISGFKSFVEPTMLDINEGLTGVVGPNGCGKSNLVEALRWVMGETSAKRMRGGEMDDVIFGGTSSRPARNVAEVGLVIDNSDLRAPAALNKATELNIARRIERTKGSNYRVNGRDVRSRDVQLLFADAGTGARSAGMVSQGRIGAIINADPSDRRILLEEAANVRGLHTRRHEAELRLNGASLNLERLEDVITALKTQMHGLRRQADQAKRYRVISEQIRRAESILLYCKWKELFEVRATSMEELKDMESLVAVATERAAQESAKRADTAAGMPTLRDAEIKAASKLQRLTLAEKELDSEQQRTATAHSEAVTRLRQIGGDFDRETALAREGEQGLARLNAEEVEIREAALGLENHRKLATDDLMQINQKVEELEVEIAKTTELIANADAKRASLEQLVRTSGDREYRLCQGLENLEANKQKLLNESGNIIALERTQSIIDEADQRLCAADKRVSELGNRNAIASEKLEKAKTNLYDIETELANLQAESKALDSILISEISDGVIPLIDQIEVQPGFEKALGSSIGDDLFVPLNLDVDNGARRHWGGKASFKPKTPLPKNVRPLIEVVSGPRELEQRLSQIGIADNAQAASLTQNAMAPGQRLTTADGGLWRWDGYIAEIDAPIRAVLRSKQRNQLKEIKEKIYAKQQRKIKVELAYSEARLNLENVITESRQATEEQRSAVLDRDVVGKQKGKIDDLERKLINVQETQARLQSEKAEAVNDRKTAEAELTSLPDVEKLRRSNIDFRSDLTDQRAELINIRSKYDQSLREAQYSESRLAAIGKEKVIWDKRIEQAKSRIKELENRRDFETKEINRLKTRPIEIKQQKAELIDAIESATVDRRKSAEALASAELAMAERDRLSRKSEQALAEMRENKIRSEGLVDQCNQGLSQLRERILERLQCLPEEILEKAGIGKTEVIPDLNSTESRLERLTRERERIGPVNLRAEQEVEELVDQISGMENERDDLLGAINRLQRAIASLNKEGKERLQVAFDAVNAHFQDLFVRLFGGGRAHLAMIEADDPLDAGLEIMASPPGKKLQVMSLLSGGEQALAALALVFAAFLTNPSPICVLDEVDAPLDDSNVDRFCSLLSDISHSTGTRFLIITHHRLTMARMDRLFGVTMAEQGVSQLVSVDLEVAEQFSDSSKSELI